MDIKELFKGVAVVIDNNVHDTESNDLILKIIEKIEGGKIPLLKYDHIPEDDIITNFNNVGFILLDWELFEKPEGVYFDDQPFIDDIIKFIKKLKEISFSPIFIFSHLDSNTIMTKLKEEDLYKDDSSNYIFVKKKSDLIDDRDENKIFEEIEEWLKQAPSIYVLREWEKSLNEAKNKLFWEFYDINHKWPSILQETFTEDGSDVNHELGDFIFKNIMARTEPIQFDPDILKISDEDLTKEEIRKVLEAERFIKNDSLPDMPYTGDLFKKSEQGRKYLINIRPDCDIARKANPSLYLIEGSIADESLINTDKEEDKKKRISFNRGSFIEKEYIYYLPFFEGQIIQFDLKELSIRKWNEIKGKRVGRLLHPYITKLQQKYSFYLQRQGLPAIPEKAI